MGPSIDFVSSCLSSAWIAFTLALIVATPRASSAGALTDTGCQMGRLVYSLWLVWILTGLSRRL